MLIETTHEIDAPVADVWTLFGEGFGDISSWASVILESGLNGPLEQGVVRTCELKGGPLTEELVLFDRGTRALTYAIRSGLPGMVKRAENAWTMEPLGEDRTRVTSRCTVDLAWWALPMTPMVRSQFGATLHGLCHELAAAVEGD